MSDVVVTQAHNLGVAGAREKVGAFEEMMKKYGVKAEWNGSRAELKGTGVSGDIVVTDTQVKITIKLGMMARAIGVDGDRLKASIEKRLGPALSGEA